MILSNENIIKEAYQITDATCKAIKSLKFQSSICDAAYIIANSVDRGSTTITTGMGKAGHIAQKTSSLLSSLGVPSFYIHPGEASHGDIGVIRPNDVLLVFSTSGKTREVIETIDLSKKLKIGKIISITSHPNSVVRDKSDVVIDMGIIKEEGNLNIAPTTSIVVMLVIADIISVTASKIIGFNMSEYATRHHGGYLGEKSRREITSEK